MSERSISESVGQVLDTAVKVSRSVSIPLKTIWMALMSQAGAEALLGPGGRILDKGHAWRSLDGTHGVTRSFHPLEQIRFTWHADDHSPATLVDLRLHAEGDGARLEIEQINLPDDADREALIALWSDVLDRVTETARADAA